MSLPHTFFIGRGGGLGNEVENVSGFQSATTDGRLILYKQNTQSTSRFIFKASGEFWVAMIGASGRKGKYSGSLSGAGGAGYAKISSDLSQVYSVFIGSGSGSNGGHYNGGAAGNGSGSFGSVPAGGGGGGTFMWEGNASSPSLSNIIACVGGGGGAGGEQGSNSSKHAGHGGGFLQNGGQGNGDPAQSGSGGTQSAGGARATNTHGHGSNNHAAGSAFQGGQGSASQYDGGCGAGSGYYGGGGGAAGGGYDGGSGGGGSGYLRTSGSNAAVAGSYAGMIQGGANHFNFASNGFETDAIAASGITNVSINSLLGSSSGNPVSNQSTDGNHGGIMIWAAD